MLLETTGNCFWSLHAMAERWEQTGIFTACEAPILDTVSGGSVLDGLQFPDWSQGHVVSSNDTFAVSGGIPRAGWHLAEWGCQSPTPGATPAQHQCVSPLLSHSASDTTDEVGTM